MNLKESFRYQNFLEGLLNTAIRYMSSDTYAMKTTQDHFRSKAVAGAIDENVDLSKDRTLNVTVDKLVTFIETILAEKDKLSDAINSAKATLGFDLDTVLGSNKRAQNVAQNLSYLANRKNKETIRRGNAYTLNVEGNQISYYYDIKEATVVDFNKENVKAIAKRLITECDKKSAEIDLAMVSTNVEYKAPYNVNDKFEEIVESLQKKDSLGCLDGN